MCSATHAEKRSIWFEEKASVAPAAIYSHGAVSLHLPYRQQKRQGKGFFFQLFHSKLANRIHSGGPKILKMAKLTPTMTTLRHSS